MSHYLDILRESAWTASIIPLSSQPTFFAMQSFGGYDMRLAFLLAVTGATAGQSFNWLIGRFLLSLKNKGKLVISEHWYARVAAAFNRYGVFLLIFSWAPLCNLLVVIAGFVNARFLFVLPLILVGQLFNYGRYLL